MKLHKLLALLLSLSMLLPMVVGIVPASAEETVAEELPTETLPDTGNETQKTEGTYLARQVWDFSEESQSEDFSLLNSGTDTFSIADGVLKPTGNNGEMKAVLNQMPAQVESVSVDINPGESGTINAGLYFGASNAGDSTDQIQAQAILVVSDHTGWADAPNRIDITYGQFNNNWQSGNTTISESSNNNNLFSNKTKKPLNLKLVFSEDAVLMTLSVKDTPSKYLQYIYQVDPELLQGTIGLRAFNNDNTFDNLTICYQDTVPDNAVVLDFEDSIQKSNFDSSETDTALFNVLGGRFAASAGESITKAMLTGAHRNIKSVSVDMYPVSGNRFIGGFYLGSYDTDMAVLTGGGRGSENNKAWGEFIHQSVADGQYTEVARVRHETFFPEGVRVPVSLKLVFEGDTVVVTMTKQDDASCVLQNVYAFDHSQFDGGIGLVNSMSNLAYDNLTIEYEDAYELDFGHAAHANEFTMRQSSTSTFAVTEGALQADGANGIAEAILNRQFEGVESLSVDMYPVSTRFIGGFYIGSEATATAFLVGGGRTNNSNKAWGELIRYNTSDLSYKEVGSSNSRPKNATMFTDGVRKPVNLKLEFDENTVTVTMTLLEDATVFVSHSYDIDLSNYNGQVGLVMNQSQLKFDNLKIVFDEALDYETSSEAVDSGVTYQNEGYVFVESNRRQWRTTGEPTQMPLTLEAWVKVPKGVMDSRTGCIVTNKKGQPYASMEMAEYGTLRLAWGEEKDDLSLDIKNFDADYDLRTGKWTHVAYSCDLDADTVTCYINGEVAKTWENAGITKLEVPDIYPGNPYVVGAYHNVIRSPETDKFMGWIADVRLWDRPLSASELQDSMMTQYTTAKDGLMLNVPLDGLVNDTFPDLSGNGYHLIEYSYDQWFGLEEAEKEPGAYSIVVIPDQQVLTHFNVDKLNTMYQWIADNREKENIQMVLNVGDICNSGAMLEHWERSKAAWELLPDDLPFIAAPGNHDYDTGEGWNKGYGVRELLKNMNTYFPMSLFENYPTDFGALSRDQGVEDNVANTWQAFEVNGNKYLVLALEYVPREDTLEWCNKVAEEHPDHQIMMVTHSYLEPNAYVSRPEIWSSFLSKHKNVIMTFSGHVSNGAIVRRVDKGVHGNDVVSILTDAQYLEGGSNLGGMGMVAILRFNADGTQCNVSYYSTYHDKYEVDSNFTIHLPKQDHGYAARVGVKFYTTVAEAIANANGEPVKMMKNTDEAITVNSDLILDLDGYKLSNVTVAEGATLTLIDTATDDYEGEYGSANITGAVVGGENYLLVQADGAYSAHAYAVEITHISLDPTNDALGYKAQVKGDEVVLSRVTGIGFNLWVDGGKVNTYTKNGATQVTLRLKNILKHSGGEMNINATAFVILAVGENTHTETGSQQTTTMKETLKLVNDAWETYSETQQAAVRELVNEYSSVTDEWNLDKIQPTIDIPIA